ncbi:MAG: hypothetical protein IB618_03000 [Candidatus Pacearchaeota archaeon]|nr:MAG: hypothetical protein IB618_03000 [Candidatus Pacearchaeota archaeon]
MKKKETFDATINEREFKIILWIGEDGMTKVYKEQPKNIDPNIHASGAHYFKDKPEKNHWDHYHYGQHFREYFSGANIINVSGASIII